MILPSKEVQEQYVRTQRDGVLKMKFQKEFEIFFNKEFLKTSPSKDKKREAEDIIARDEKMIEGYEEYIDVLNEYVPEKQKDLTPNGKKEVLSELKDEIERGNFRGLLGKQVQERRLKKAKENDAIRVAEDDIEKAVDDLARNELKYEKAVEWLKNL